MDNLNEKPQKPGWFWIVEAIISLALFYLIYTIWTGAAKFFMRLGLPPMVGLIAALMVLAALVHWVILPKWKVGECDGYAARGVMETKGRGDAGPVVRPYFKAAIGQAVGA